jgi:tetratricopeptide (TPR) repeat protein
VRAYVGDAEVAIEHFERANQLNPLDPEIGYVLSGLGFAYLMAGRPDGAMAIARRALLDAPAFVPSRWVLLYGLAETEQWNQARRVAAELLAHQPRLRVATILAANPFVHPRFVELQRAALEGAGFPP